MSKLEQFKKYKQELERKVIDCKHCRVEIKRGKDIYIVYQTGKERYFHNPHITTISSETGITLTNINKYLIGQFRDKLISTIDRIDKIVDDYLFETNKKPSITYLKNKLGEVYDKNELKYSGIFSYWNLFIQYKRDTCVESTVRPYLTIKRIIFDFYGVYQKYYDMTYENVNASFFNDLIQYLVNEHKHYTVKEGNRIGYNDNQVKRKLTYLLEYLRYVVTNDKSINIDFDMLKLELKKVTNKNNVTYFEHVDYALTNDELSYLVYLLFDTKDFVLKDTERRTMCTFLFMCLHGLSNADIIKISKNSIIDGKYLIGGRTKTNIEFKVQINDIGWKILEEYNFKLVLNNHDNYVLKRVFKLFFERYKEQVDSDYNLMFETRIKKGGKTIIKKDFKWNYIKMKTSRYTFITNAYQNKDYRISEIQKMVGHKQGSRVTFKYLQNEEEKGNVIKLKKFN